MRIVMMNGGLGNQLYQYVFVRYLELSTGERCVIDDCAFFGDNVCHNGYELEKIFGIKLKRLSESFSTDVWDVMINKCKEGIGIPQQLLDNGIDLTMMEEFDQHLPFSGNRICMPSNKFSNEIGEIYARAIGNIYYFGYWCIYDFVRSMMPYIRDEFRFNELNMIEGVTPELIEIQKRIRNEDSAAIHIRRGDFVKVGRAKSAADYSSAVCRLKNKTFNGTLFVFSDDILWCKEHEAELGLNELDHVYIEGTAGNQLNYIDMQLMSECKHMIISNSSFGIWAALLNEREGLDMDYIG